MNLFRRHEGNYCCPANTECIVSPRRHAIEKIDGNPPKSIRALLTVRAAPPTLIVVIARWLLLTTQTPAESAAAAAAVRESSQCCCDVTATGLMAGRLLQRT